MRRWEGLLLALAISIAAAQQVTIRSTTRLVQVRVVATDKNGAPVHHLSAADFELRDNGAPQPLTLFVAEGGAAASGSQADVAEQEADSGSGFAVILLDWLNTQYTQQLFARDKAVKLLKTFQPRQKVALYLLNRKPGLLLNFTDDRDELLHVLENVELEPDPAVSGRASVEEQLFDFNRKILDSAQSLRNLARDLAHVPGRKALLWVSAGFPVTVDGKVVRGAHPGELVYVQELERILTQFNGADVAIYSIDACGLSVKCRDFGDAMNELAVRTGGTTFRDRNDLDTGMRLALEDLSTSYTLGFHAPEDGALGLHAIQVKVNRPGVILRYRESYRLDR